MDEDDPHPDEPGGVTDGGDADSADGDGGLSDEEYWAKYGEHREAQTEAEAAFWSTYGGSRETERTLQGKRATAGLEGISRADLREHYGPLRTLFKRREQRYTGFQRQLEQARVRDTYDQYLARLVARTLSIVAAGVVLGVVAGLAVLAGAGSGTLPVSPVGPGGSASAAVTVAALFAGAGLVGAGLYWAWHRVLKLRSRIARRRRDIDYNLPYAVVFMFALSRAGVGFDRIFVRLADSTETYGAVAEEFDRVVRDVEMFGNNLYNALENLRSVTPSEELRRVTDDITVVLETGGDLTEYLHDEIETQFENAVAEQESFIRQLELLSEVFVVGLVAAPLFVLVVLMVVAFLGAETLSAMALVVYAVVPLALAGFVVLVDAVSGPFTERPVSFAPGREGKTPPPSDDDPEWRAAYERSKRLAGLRERVRAQAAAVRDEPWRALLFSVPVAAALPVGAVLTGAVSPTVPALVARPVRVTTALAAAPLVVATVPVALVHEYRRRQERALQRRFPDVLELLATSNRRGLSLTRGLDIVADSASGRLADELRYLRNDIRWNDDLPGAFEAFGDRLVSPTLTRTVKLLAEGSRATRDLYPVLNVAATDVAERVRLERERRRTLQTYLVVVVVGFLVYLLVVLVLAANFLDPIEAASASLADAGTGAAAGPVTLADVPVPELRVVLFHSALIQGFGSGLLAGKIAEGTLYGGLKYGLGLVVLTLLAFTVV